MKPGDIFFAVLKPFLNEIAFYAKLLRRFSGRVEIRFLAENQSRMTYFSKFDTNIQLINLKLPSKLHIARLGLPYRPENSGHVRNLGLNLASGSNF